MIFHRSRRQLVPNNSSRRSTNRVTPLCVNFGQGTIIEIRPSLSKAAGLRAGRNVVLIVEIRNDWHDHPYMWCRFPRIGPIPRCEFLRAMALRLEWQDLKDGAWKTCYLSQGNLWKQIVKQPDQLQIYRDAIHIYAATQRMKFSGAPPWFPKFKADIVNFIQYNHMEQKGKLFPVLLSATPWPQMASQKVNRERIRAQCIEAGAPTFIGIRPNYFPRMRDRCDLCLSVPAEVRDLSAPS